MFILERSDIPMAETKQRQHEILLEIIAELRKIASRSFEDSHQRERALKEAAILIGDAYDADAFSVGFANVNEWVRWMREKGPKQPYFSIRFRVNGTNSGSLDLISTKI